MFAVLFSLVDFRPMVKFPSVLLSEIDFFAKFSSPIIYHNQWNGNSEDLPSKLQNSIRYCAKAVVYFGIDIYYNGNIDRKGGGLCQWSSGFDSAS